MKNALRTGLFASVAIGAIGLIVYLFLTNELTLLQPKGIIAEQQKDLLVFATILSLIVILPVYILTVTIVLKYRETNKTAKYSPDYDHSKRLETLWWGVPIILIFILSVVTWKTTHLDPFKPLASDKQPLTVQVVALQWKWLFIYPEQKIATVNYLRIPEDTPIRFEITSDAPMNSFWIPQLGGQIYAMSGMTTELNLMAYESGMYDGYSANISGTNFADMRFTTKSTTDIEFNEWVYNSQLSTSELNKETYSALSSPGIDITNGFYTLEDTNLFGTIVNKYMSHGHAKRPNEVNIHEEGAH